MRRYGWQLLYFTIIKMKNEKREHWIDCVDEDNALFEVYFHWELRFIVRWYEEAKKELQRLVDEEDYYNGNEKVDEFDI